MQDLKSILTKSKCFVQLDTFSLYFLFYSKKRIGSQIFLSFINFMSLS